MTRRRAVVGMSFVCALFACAFITASASATTLYICEEGGGAETFVDSHCETAGAGKWTTVAPAENVPKAVVPTNTAALFIKSKIGGTPTEIKCEAMKGTGEATNIIGVGSLMQVEGKKTVLKYSQCTVEKPIGKSCAVKGLAFETKMLKSLTETVAGVTKVKLSPEAGTVLAEVTIEKCTSAINGTYKLEGSLVGIVNAASPARLEFTAASSPGLKFGGETATVEDTTHLIIEGTEKTIAIK